MLRVARFAVLSMLLLPLVVGSPSFAAPSGATDGDAAGFARARTWFEGLGFLALKWLPFVRVWTGGYQSQSDGKGNERIELEPELGWLVGENGDVFRVFTTQLRVERFRRREVPGHPEARVDFDRIDLTETIVEGLAALDRLAVFEKTHAPTADRPSPLWRECDPFGDTRMVPSLQFKGFVLACVCAQNGEERLALRLWDRLASQAPWPAKESWSVLDDLKAAIGYEAHLNLILDLKPQEGSWEDHLLAHRRWLGRFPGHFDTEQVRTEILALEKTARVDAARREAPRRAPSEMSESELVEDLVARLSDPFAFLTDQFDGKTLSALGIAVPERGEWPLLRLIALGDAAVPRLIDAITDDRWTRSVSLAGGPSKGWLREKYYVERVGDLALVGLGAIMGEDFSEQGRIGRRAFFRGPGESIIVLGDAASAQAKARTWWADRRKGASPGK